MNDLKNLQSAIDAAFEFRAEITPKNIPTGLEDVLEECIGLLDSGSARVAEQKDGIWVVNEWLKKAVLLYFRTRDNVVMDAGFTRFYDKVPLKYADSTEAELRAAGARVVPHAVVRRGAFVASNVVLMPCYVNIGAYVGVGHDGGHLGDGWVLRADRTQRASVGRCRDRRSSGAAAGEPDHH